MTGSPFVSVVIPAYRRTEMLRKAVESLFAQDYPRDRYEILVVDSSPEHDNERMLVALKAAAPCCLEWARKKAEGPGPSRNLGIAMSRGEYVAFMDSDCFASPTWLRSGIQAFSDGIGLVQGRTLPDPAKPLGIFKWYVRIEKETPTYETANILYRRSALDGAGGFPADLTPGAETPLGGEDVIVAWNVKRLGWNSCFAPDALVWHEVVALAPWNWICIRRLYIWPSLIARFPELRRFMFRSYFLDRGQALLVAALAGLLLGTLLHPVWLSLCAAYPAYRMLEPTRSRGGPMRLARIVAYLARDAASFVLLLAGSVRYRCLLL